MAKHTDILQKYDLDSKTAADNYRKEIAALREKSKQYGINVNYEIDQAKEKLKNREMELKSNFDTEVAAEIATAKRSAVVSGNITSVEKAGAESFIADVRLQLAINGAGGASEMMQQYSDSFSAKQRAHILKTLVSDLAAQGADVKQLATEYGDSEANDAHEAVKQLQAIVIEDATMHITNVYRSHETFTRPRPSAVGNTADFIGDNE